MVYYEFLLISNMPPVIEQFDRGEMKIDGQNYNSDLIICENKVYDNWRRSSQSKLTINDLQFIISERPAYMVIGSGQNQQLQIESYTQKRLNDLGFEIYIAKTRTAVRKYNKMVSKQKTIGVFCLY